MNFEKYRGIYGVIDQTGSLVHRRLTPGFRNLFVVPIVAEEEYPILTQFARDGMVSDFNMINDSNSVILHYLFNNSGTDTSDHMSDWIFYSFPMKSRRSNDINREYTGQKRINTMIIDSDELNSIYSTYCVQYNQVPEILEQLYQGFREPYPAGFTAHVQHEELCPEMTLCCFTFFEVFNEGSDSLIKARQRIAFGHELGHFVGMIHPVENAPNRSIMTYNLPDSETQVI